MPKRSSSVVGREFGNGIRAIIARTGLTHRKLAELLGWQEAKISDMTLGKGGVTEQEVVLLLGYCQATVEEREHLLELFHESGNAWLQIPEDGLPDQVRTLIEQEKDAEEITCWSMILVPGLLQTLEYGYVIAEHSTVIEADESPRSPLPEQRERTSWNQAESSRSSCTRRRCCCRSAARRCGASSSPTCSGCRCGSTSACGSFLAQSAHTRACVVTSG